jgi:hypothetical protein
MSRISGRRAGRRGGYTILELAISLSIALIVLGGVFSAYIFLGRNLTRLVYSQEQDVKSRRALRQFTNDVSSAISLTSTTSANLTFTVPTTLTNCLTASGNATVTCDNTGGMLAGSPVWDAGPIALTHCSTTTGSAAVACDSTAGMLTNAAVSGTGIATNTVVKSITNSTTFVMSANATATSSGATFNTAGRIVPSNTVVNSITNSTTFVMSANATSTATGATLYTTDTISYNYSTGNATLTRADVNKNITTTLLTGIDPSATNPSNGFVYYNTSDTAVTAATSVKKVQLAFTTIKGTAATGTQASYVTISPHVVVHNKAVSQ